MRTKHLMSIPWTGLGLYGGFRGNRWLRNRIKVFKHFVLPSLLAQTNQNFVVWCSWRPEEKYNPIVQDFIEFMDRSGLKTVHTFHGICFWDDKYQPLEARLRLVNALHGSIGELLDTIGECDEVLMTIQPSDDCYWFGAVDEIQEALKGELQAVGYKHGYMMNYLTGEMAEYNPTTNPPFFTIKFPRETFIQPLEHMEYTGPYESHEYVGNKLKYKQLDRRGFLVGTHGENISTTYVHPFKGLVVEGMANLFGLQNTPPIKIKTSIRRAILRRLPHKVQRKLRYWIGERVWQRIYEFLRS